MYYNRLTITKSITLIIYFVFFLFLLDSVTFCDIGADPVGVIMSACVCYMWNLLYLHGFIRFSDGFLPHYLYCMWDFMVYDRVFECDSVDPILYRRNSFFIILPFYSDM